MSNYPMGSFEEQLSAWDVLGSSQPALRDHGLWLRESLLGQNIYQNLS